MEKKESIFDKKINRKNTNSLKWDKYYKKNIIPMWVADMDFKTAPSIIKSLKEKVNHGIFGYFKPPKELNKVIKNYMEQKYGWRVEENWIIWLPSLVVGLNVMARALTYPKESIITTTPIYPPFISSIQNSGRGLIKLQLKNNKNRWSFDIEAFKNKITDKTSVMFFCNPHNPTGKVFSEKIIRQIGKICMKNKITILSDEIHSGLILDENKSHFPFAKQSKNVCENTVTLQSASKTFNIPGLGCAFAIASNINLRKRILSTMNGIVHHVGSLGFIATKAAFSTSDAWHKNLISYLKNNRDLLESELKKMPYISSNHVEATYLIWIDCRKLPVNSPVKFFEKNGVGLYDGILFSKKRYLRMNFACPIHVLKEAINRMKQALIELKKEEEK